MISEEMKAAAQRGGAENINGRDFLVSGSVIGLYSLPEIVAKVDNTSGEMWTVDRLNQKMNGVTGDLKNMFPKKEEKPA